MATFGEYFKELRIGRGLTLRAFCKRHGFDPGNISKLERGKMPPPESERKLTEYVKALGVKRASDEWYEFFDRAAAERGRIPHDLLSDGEVVDKLPVLFRTLRGRKMDVRKLTSFVDKIRKA